MNIFKNKNKAFTIIELLVVIAIIAILAAIVLANVTSYQKKTKINRAFTEFNNMWKAATMFYEKYGDYPNNTDTNPGTDPSLTVGSNTYYLSEFYKANWSDASYICSGCMYVWYAYSKTCIYGIIRNANWNKSIGKNLSCTTCTYACGQTWDSF